MGRAFSWIMFAFAAVLLLTGPFACQPGCADDFTPKKYESEQFAEYERQLNALLKTRYDEEKKFVAEIVAQVRLGNIPSSLVTTSYSWVRNRRPRTYYPFIYFEKVIRIQATSIDLGDEIPKFDYSIYGSDNPSTAGQNSSVGSRNFAGPQKAASQKTATRSNSLFRKGTKR